MIITKLIGGLGNQLFQYAIAKNLSIIHKTDILIDKSEFEKYKLHKYALSNFKLKEKFSTESELKKSLDYKEKKYSFDTEFKSIQNNSLLIGYWQSEKYFREIRNIILDEFTIKSKLYGENYLMAKTITNTNSVSIHIRRSDYLPNTYKDQILESLSLSYYENAVKEMAYKIKSPNFYIFSDDIKWVKTNLNINFPHIFVGINNFDNAFEDLRLMSLCKNNIIANSSFSWWAAWLNKNDEKIVIAPKNWFSLNAKNLYSNDLIPSNWIKL